jgi:segregation and condensation protein B
MRQSEQLQIVEALLFASPEPLNQSRLNTVFEDDALKLSDLVKKLREKYEKEKHGFEVRKVAGGYQFATRAEFSPWVRRLIQNPSKLKLSAAALESLAIVAYKQPLSRFEIESIRGVDCSGVLKTLLSRQLLKIAGRAEGPGRPLLYGTTREFLEHFGLDRLSDLPRLREITELTAEEEPSAEHARAAE